MLVELLEKATEQFSRKLPFVLYRKPNAGEVTFMAQGDATLHQVTTFAETGFVFAPFEKEQKTILIPPDMVDRAKYTPRSVNGISDLTYPSELPISKKKHLALVEKGIEAIEKGAFEKVVLSRKIEVDCTKSPIKLFRELLDVYQKAFCYLWYHPEVGVWLGATPETLTTIRNRKLKTMSLAGTREYNIGASPDWGQKERNEQKLVTSYISDALHGTISNIEVSETTSVRAGNLWHLRTVISGVLQHSGIKNVIEALHPTPAVCGLPQKASEHFIREHEGYSREYYTGYLGEMNIKERITRPSTRRNQENKAYGIVRNNTALYVNLRCMQFQNNKAIVYVGGGVTKASIPEKEWEETVAKSKTILKIVFN